MTIGNHSSPIINQQKSKSRYRQFINKWKFDGMTSFLKLQNVRYTLLWLVGGITLVFYIKPRLRRYEKELVIEDIEEYLKKRKNE